MHGSGLALASLSLAAAALNAAAKQTLCRVNPSGLSLQPLRQLQHFFLKRDDLLELSLGTSGAVLSGNKARKFKSLVNTLHGHRGGQIDCVFSIGGNNSNAMLALSKICFANQLPFTYYTRDLPPALLSALQGDSVDKGAVSNLSIASKVYKASIVSLDFPSYSSTMLQLEAEAAEQAVRPVGGRLVIARGGSDESAREGLAELALELLTELAQMQLQEPLIKKWVVAVASGTGATAYYCHVEMRRLTRALPDLAGDVTVLALPCVGSSAYLTQQMERLRDSSTAGGADPTLPAVAAEGDAHKRVFARPCTEHLALYQQLRALGAAFDLVYAPRAAEVLAAHIEARPPGSLDEVPTPLLAATYPTRADASAAQVGWVLYCCGGAEGDAGQLARYQRMGMGGGSSGS